MAAHFRFKVLQINVLFLQVHCCLNKSVVAGGILYTHVVPGQLSDVVSE